MLMLNVMIYGWIHPLFKGDVCYVRVADNGLPVPYHITTYDKRKSGIHGGAKTDR
jgi:hypothetical protein